MTQKTRLAILDLTVTPPRELLVKIKQEFQFAFLLLPVAGIDGIRNGATVSCLSSVEASKGLLLTVLSELFEQGANDAGPRAENAASGFAASSGYALWNNSRFSFVLLKDLAQLTDLGSLQEIVLFADKPRGGPVRMPISCLAKAIPCRLRIQYWRGKNAGPKQWLLDRLPDPSQPWWQSLRERIRPVPTGNRRIPTVSDGYQSSNGKLRTAMLVYHPKSVRHLLPVREELIRSGHAVDFFSPRPEVEAALERANCTAFSLAGGLAPRQLADAVADFIQKLPLNLPAKTKNDQILAVAFRSALQRLAFFELILYSRCAGPLGYAFKSGAYQLAVGTDSGSTAGRCFFSSAEQLGIKTAFLQHGSFSVGPDVAPYFTKAQIYTWGETSRQQLIDSKVSDPERIVAIGSSFEEDHLQAVASPGAGTRPLILVTFGVPGNLVPERPFLAACREVLAAAALRGDCDFVVKLHPGDRTKVWHSAIQECAAGNVKVSELDTYTLLGQCSALITMFSTTGAEAICLGKPVVSVNLENFPATNDYLRANAAYKANAPGSVHAILDELFTNPFGHDRLAPVRAEFAERMLHREAIPAGKRIASALENLVLERAEGRTPC